MKKIFLILALFLSFNAFSQAPTTTPTRLPQNAGYVDPATGLNWFSLINGIYWRPLQLPDTASLLVVHAFTITSLPAVGQTITAGTPNNVIHQLFNQSQPPTALLTGGTVYELTTSNQSHNLNYTYGRQSATATIATAVINPGSLTVFGSQPSQPGTVTGPIAVITIANTNTTYTLTVTTTDSKTATATTTDTFLPRLYYGRCAGSAPITTEILAFAGGSNPLTGLHAIGPVTIVASGSNRPFFSYPSSEGSVTLIKDVNGFDVTTAFNLTTVSLTNASGYTQTYNIYTLNAATASNYTITTN